MIALDLFCGVGGWSVACKNLDIDEVGIEIDKDCVATREAAGFKTIKTDVRVVDPIVFVEYVFNKPIDILIASPPCQDFSTAGKKAGLDSERGQLVYEVQRFYRTLQPDYIACEQVPAVLPIWEEFARELNGQGYWTWTGILHAEQYGVPQTRKRSILMARRIGGPINPPVPTHSKYYPRKPERLDKGVLPWVSMQEALGWDEYGLATHTTFKDPIHVRESYKPAQTISEHLRDAKVVLDTHRGKYKGNYQFREIHQPSPTMTEKARGQFHLRPSPTISAGGTETGGAEPIANQKLRKQIGRLITVEEAAALQTFPKDFPFQGTRTSKFRQIGNAIPPMLAEVVLKELIK